MSSNGPLKNSCGVLKTPNMTFVKRTKLRVYVYILDFGGNWDDHLPLVEFAYNNSFQSSIGMAHFEAMYDQKCRSLVCWDKVSEQKILGPKLKQATFKKITLIREIENNLE